MKLLFGSDFHLDHTTQGVSRFEELRDAVQQMVDTAIEQEVDAFIFGGDLCDPDSGSCVFRAMRVALEAAGQLSDNGIANYWLVGNHDVIEDGSGDTTLDPLFAIQNKSEIMQVLREPALVVNAALCPYSLLALPFTPTCRNYDASMWVEKTLASPVNIQPGGIIVLSHLSMPWVQPGEETTEMPRGRDVEFPLQALANSGRPIACVLSGHYHRQQELELPHIGKCIIPGSLAQLTFSEEGKKSGFVIVELP